MDSQRWCGLILILGAVAFAGCGGQKTYPVKGTVSVKDGEPLSKGYVVFTSEKFTARGEIGPDGDFVLSSSRVDDGAPPGTYKVTLIGTGDGPTYENPDIPVRRSVDEKYEASNTTPLELTVEPKANEFDIEADPPK